MNSFQLIITYLKFSILFVFEYPFYIDCLFTIFAVALHLFERTCKLCKKDVEDEIHFVCVCPALELIRMKYFKILNIDKSELLIDQLSRVLTHMNVNMVINCIPDAKRGYYGFIIVVVRALVRVRVRRDFLLATYSPHFFPDFFHIWQVT